MKNLVFLFLLIVSSFKIYAISELNYAIDFNVLVKPLLQSMVDGHFLSNKANIHYKTLIQEHATSCLIILPGRTEPSEKYAEFIYDINQTSLGHELNYFVMDHRGQGSSDRLSSTYDLGHVDHFDNYISDVKNFLDIVVSKSDCKRRFLFAHSMGAGIGLSFVLENPDYFNALAISSPMLKIQTKPYPYLVAKTIVTSMVVIGKGATFAAGQKGYNPNNTFENNKYTSSKERFEMAEQIFKDLPKTILGGPSNKWIYEVMKGTSSLRRKYKKITAPMNVYIAGNESYSEPSDMHKLCAKALQCNEFNFPNSKHEIYNDRDENREAMLTSVVELFSKI
jgi:lysophospholipase